MNAFLPYYFCIRYFSTKQGRHRLNCRNMDQHETVIHCGSCVGAGSNGTLELHLQRYNAIYVLTVYFMPVNQRAISSCSMKNNYLCTLVNYCKTSGNFQVITNVWLYICETIHEKVPSLGSGVRASATQITEHIKQNFKLISCHFPKISGII